VIVGGGWGGLAAATRLIEVGWKVTLIERARQLGGRSTSFWDDSFGEWLDHGPHVFIGAYRAAMELLEKWDSASLIDFESGNSINWLTPGGKRYKFDLTASLAGAALSLVKFGYLSLFERASLVKALTVIAKYDGHTATLASVLKPFGATKGRLGEFFEALTVAVMNAPPDLAAAKPMAEAIRAGLLAGGDSARIGLPRRSLKEIVSDPAKNYLEEHGVDLRIGYEAKSIVRQGAGGFIVTGDGFEIETDVTIIALPPVDIARLLLIGCGENIFSADSSQLAYAPIAGVHLVFERPVLDIPFGLLSGGFGHWIFGRGGREEGGWRKVSVVISYAPNREQVSTDIMAERVINDIRLRLPQATDAKVEKVRAVRTVRATVILTPEALKHRATEQTKCPGLYLAGDWCDTGLPATIESAARSGNKAAELALRGS